MTRATELYDFAKQYIPGGVSASARVNPAINHPFFISRGNGAYVYDLDGKEYIDMCMSHGASLLGHNHSAINDAVLQAMEMGIICAYETEYHSALAQRLSEIIPCGEMSRFSGSGTETIMHAIRVARTATGRQKILKIEGHFHGYADEVNFSWAPPLDKAGSTDAPLPYPQSSGIPPALSNDMIIVPFNHPVALRKAFEAHHQDIATLILEPINYDAGCLLPDEGYLELCRKLCDEYGVILFFDEVLTAFRMALGGAQEYLDVTPDLCVLGKAFGAGMPISAISGKREIMNHMRPVGTSEHSGTYLAHITAVLAAIAAVEVYSQPDFYTKLNGMADDFYRGFQGLINQSGLPIRLMTTGPRFGMHFGIDHDLKGYRDIVGRSAEMEQTFIRACIERGVYFHVALHHGMSAVHSADDMARVLEVIEQALDEVKQSISTTS